MTIIDGFELVRQETIQELRTEARLIRHVKTGARVLSLSNDDENKVFGIVFRTPPGDSTGVAHILEHSVLCGSRKYPVKEPFVELLKGSLKTFLNAFTYPDKTCYPVASQNVQDLYNLMDVYLDAVFHPRITRHIFEQEGWHYELESLDSPLKCKGVVYNEMKGAYSSPDSLLTEYSQQSLFPDTTYGVDSGGNPKKIPDLTYERFLEFHRRLYHPSNAYILCYGDDDPAQRLEMLRTYLDEFEPLTVDSTVSLQPPFEGPKRMTRPFPGGEEDGGGKGMLTVNWLLPEVTDLETNVALHFLEYILLGMPASPLRKALIESGLGEDLAGIGLETELRQMYFSTGLKGIDPSDADRVENLIFSVLGELVEKGIDAETVEAAFNTIEFRLRENNYGQFPRGLVLMLRALTTWLYDGDPLAMLAFEAPVEALKSRYAQEKRYFEELMDSLLLRNDQRTTVVLEPDPGMREREDRAEKERLSRARSAMSQEELQSILENTGKLRKMQEAPDPPEALATIPTLTLDDLAKTNKTIPMTPLEKKSASVLYHDLFTNGILYLDLGFDLHTLMQEHLPFVPLFSRALLEMGTREQDFVTLTQRISRKTGGIHPSSLSSMTLDGSESAAWLFLRAKAVVEQAPELFDILRDVLLEVRLDQRDRFKQMVLEEKARFEKGLIPGGHQIVNLRLRAHFNEAGWVAEQMKGISYLFFLRDLVRRIDEDWPGLLETLESIRRTLVNRRGMILNVTLDEANWKSLEPQAEELLDALPEDSIRRRSWTRSAPGPDHEGLTLPSQVNYVGKGLDLYALGYGFHGSALVVTRFLRNGWLWDRIRVQGGAYGAFCLFDRFSGVLSLLSYRDPSLLKTLEVYNETEHYLRNLQLSRDELTKSIIGAIGEIDAYMLPDAKGYTSMVRHLTKNTDEIRQKMRDQVLATTDEDFIKFADALGDLREEGLVKVLGSQEAVWEAVAEGGGALDIVNVI